MNFDDFPPLPEAPEPAIPVHRPWMGPLPGGQESGFLGTRSRPKCRFVNERGGATALRVGQVGGRWSHVDGRARDVEARMPRDAVLRTMPHVRRFRLSRFHSGVLALARVGASLVLVAAPPAALGAQIGHIFNFSGAMQDWTVPAGVHFAHFDVRAPRVAPTMFSDSDHLGGEGGRTVAEIRVFPGEVIHMFVGGKGGDGGTCSGYAAPRRAIPWGLQRRG